ncbi:MAG: exodeoxyribonuclease VII large subunit [Lachnospiraceae bacterium]|nr:exodeoxyribonuclease VII large subunit [Lachnospiraceae bacterium]
MNKNIYSVAQLNKYVKNMFAQDFMLNHISIKGEVSNCKYHSTGHIYFTLKDQSGTLSCVMFRGNRSGLNFQMKEGDKVIVTGNVDVYEKTGSYQLYAKEIQLDGAGNLYLQFEALKKQLQEMGMFAEEYKQPIPKYARTVGIVTAKTGAAIQDIRNVASRRNPGVQLILYPATVQGEGAAETIVAGIEALDRYGVDVIIVGRGGGSIEDLWAFNEEIVARAIFECKTPIVSAVGHEVDWTIADYVSDYRAPTPSAAAEICVFELALAQQNLMQYQIRMERVLRHHISTIREKLLFHSKRITLLSPQHKMQEMARRLSDLYDKMRYSIENRFKDRRNRLMLLAKSLESNSPLRKMESGFAYVEDAKERRLVSVSDVKKGDTLAIHLKDGKIDATIDEVTIKHE